MNCLLHAYIHVFKSECADRSPRRIKSDKLRQFRMNIHQLNLLRDMRGTHNSIFTRLLLSTANKPQSLYLHRAGLFQTGGGRQRDRACRHAWQLFGGPTTTTTRSYWGDKTNIIVVIDQLNCLWGSSIHSGDLVFKRQCNTDNRQIGPAAAAAIYDDDATL